MNIFLSWSGNLSHNVAKALVDWLPQVIQAVKPWLSSQDIEKGARWFEVIGENLSSTDFGILCLTSTNISAPWILFEAGALSKSLGQARVCPLLVNIKNADLQGPLAQFNTSGIGREEIRRLVASLNGRLPTEQKRTELQLDEAFQVWWPHLEHKFTDALKQSPETEQHDRPSPKRKVDDVLDEILELVRTSVHQLSRLSTAQRSPLQTHSDNASGLTVERFASALKMPPEDLLKILNTAGVVKSSQSDVLSEFDKTKLLEHLRTAHSSKGPKKAKVTLARKRP